MTNKEYIESLKNRLQSKVFDQLDKRDHSQLVVVQCEIAAIRQGRGIASLLRSIERDGEDE